jgi:ABC-type Mn2+/Zn2+ transport system permease subunit
MFGLPWHIVLPTLLGCLIVGAMCSAVGTFVVRLKLSSLGFAMSHAAFAGAALGLMISAFDPTWTAVLFAVVMAAALGPIADRSGLQVDTIVGATFPLTMALGLVFIHATPSSGVGSGALSLLWGSVLGITMGQVLVLTAVLALVLVVLFLFGKPFFALLLDRKLARASGLDTTRAFYVLLFLVAIVVAVSLRVTGGLLIYALMILPASAAFLWAYDIKKVFLLAPLLGVLASLGGFLLSLGADLPVGASIALCCAAVFFGSILLSPKQRQRTRGARSS